MSEHEDKALSTEGTEPQIETKARMEISPDRWETISHFALGKCCELFKPREVRVICDFILTAKEDLKTHCTWPGQDAGLRTQDAAPKAQP